MKPLDRWAAAAALALTLGTATTTRALEQQEPPVFRDAGGTGAGDPSLGGTRMPPGGDQRGVDRADRADKAAERKAREAEQKREEERRRKAAEMAAATKAAETKRAVSQPLVSRPYGQAAPPIATVASSPMTTPARRIGSSLQSR